MSASFFVSLQVMASLGIRIYPIAVLLLCGLVFSCNKASKEERVPPQQLTVAGAWEFNLPAEGGTVSVSFTSNRDWTISCDESWLTAEPLSGEASGNLVTVSVAVDSNPQHEERSAVILICADILSEKISITQGPALEYEVQMSDFSVMRGDLKIGGMLFTPKDFKGRMPVLICCHGLSGSLSDVVAYGEAAARQGFAACCFDFCGGPAGYSLSDGNRADNSLLTEVQDVAAVFNDLASRDDMDPERISLLGGSQGALVAALYAAEHPEEVQGLVLLYPAFNLPDLVRYYTDILGGLENLPESVTMMGHTIWRKYAIDAYGLYPFDLIGQYKGPVLIIHGDQDEMVPLSYSEEAAEIYNNASLIVLEGQNHGFNYLGVQQAVKDLKTFLQKL